jgi:hypothetical protein
MAVEQATGLTVGAHLVGSIKAESAEEAMRAVAGTIDNHVYAITDGETGPRKGWIGWQVALLSAVDGIEVGGTSTVSSEQQSAEVPRLAIDASISELPGRVLGYADAAEASYETFKRLRDEGVIPAGVKFQVSLPTPLAPVVTFVRVEDQERFYSVYATAMEAEVADIANAVPADDLMLQFDVAVEVGVLTGAFKDVAAKLTDKGFMVDEIRRFLALAPTGVERGVHLCYGDYEHKHFGVPQDLALCVEFANALGDALDFVHMPVDRETGLNPGYHEPLRDLAFDGRLALGVIDYRGDEQRTRDLIAAAAASAGRDFAVATECGMARIDEGDFEGPSLQRLLELHAAVATPIR